MRLGVVVESYSWRSAFDGVEARAAEGRVDAEEEADAFRSCK
jgi:hypothetical protein